MSNYPGTTNSTYTNDVNALEENLETMPESHPDFTREAGKKTVIGFDPETIVDASQIPDAYYVETQRGSYININNESIDLVKFRPEIISQIKNRQMQQQPMQQQPMQQQPMQQSDMEQYQQNDPRYANPRFVQENNPTYTQSTFDQRPGPMHKVIDLTDANLSINDECSSHSRKIPNLPVKSIFSPLLCGWKRSVFLFIMILLLMNPVTSETIAFHIPQFINPTILLVFQIALITVLCHVMNGYILT